MPVKCYYGFPIKEEALGHLYLTFSELWQKDCPRERLGTVERTNYNNVQVTPYAATTDDDTLTSLNPPANETGPSWYRPPTDDDRQQISWRGARRMGTAAHKGFRVHNFLSTAVEALRIALGRANLSDNTRKMLDGVIMVVNDNASCWTEMLQMTTILQRDFVLQMPEASGLSDRDLHDYRYYGIIKADALFNRALFSPAPATPVRLQKWPERPRADLLQPEQYAAAPTATVTALDDMMSGGSIVADIEDVLLSDTPGSTTNTLTTTAVVHAAASQAATPMMGVEPATATTATAPAPMDLLLEAARQAQIHPTQSQPPRTARPPNANQTSSTPRALTTPRTRTPTSQTVSSTSSPVVTRRPRSSVPADNTIVAAPLAATPGPLRPFTQSITPRVQRLSSQARRTSDAVRTPRDGQAARSRTDSPFDEVLHVPDTMEEEMSVGSKPALADVDADDNRPAGASTPMWVPDSQDSNRGSGNNPPDDDTVVEMDDDDDDVTPTGGSKVAHDDDDDIEEVITTRGGETVVIDDGIDDDDDDGATAAILPPTSRAFPGKGAQAAKARADETPRSGKK